MCTRAPDRRILMLAVVLGVALAVSLTPLRVFTQGPTLPDIDAACEAGEPYLVGTWYRGVVRETSRRACDSSAASVVLISDTPADSPQYSLATYEDVGAVWGLAYHAGERAVYAAAFHKRQLPFGPGGPGAIYRIDLTDGRVSLFANVPNVGPDSHERGTAAMDEAGARGVGRTSLGDLELSPDGTQLAVVNLDDRRIYRYSVPGKLLLGSFAHGAAGEPWADEARPFGLGYYNGELFHAVVRSAENSGDASDLSAHVYRSAPDGRHMTLAAQVDLSYERPGQRRIAETDWNPWTDRYPTFPRRLYHPMPIVSDIAFEAGGNMVLGIRDRRSDTAPVYIQDVDNYVEGALGASDILRGEATGNAWAFDPSAQHYDDGDLQSWGGFEVTQGGLAHVTERDRLVSGANVSGPNIHDSALGEGFFWFDCATGNQLGYEALSDPLGMKPYRTGFLGSRSVSAHCYHPDPARERPPTTVGEVEVLCVPASYVTPTPTATHVPTATPSAPTTPVPTATSAPSATPSLPSTATPTTPPLVPVYLPLLLKEHCDPTLERADIALVIDTSSSMTGEKLSDAKDAAVRFVGLMDLAPARDQVAVIRFDTDAQAVSELTGDRAAVVESIRALEPHRGTHIDLGLLAALEELESPRRIADNVPVMVLLTDGIQTGAAGAEVAAARQVRGAGVRLYTIGLGADVDEPTLREMAGDPARYYFAPDSSHLARIYGEVARDIDCPAERFWGRR